MNIYLEIFGYIGTFLILLSMMMTSVVKLRIVNIVGSVISIIYSLCTGTLPVAFLNTGLVIINIVQLVRIYNERVRCRKDVRSSEKAAE